VSSFYLDLGLLEAYYLDRPPRYHHTASSTLVSSLHAGLGRLLEEGGFELFAERGHRLPRRTAVRLPARVDDAVHAPAQAWGVDRPLGVGSRARLSTQPVSPGICCVICRSPGSSITRDAGGEDPIAVPPTDSLPQHHLSAAGQVPAPEDLLDVTISDGDERGVVITARGEVDLYTHSVLRRAIDSALTGHPPTVVLDLREVSFLSSSGLAALVDLRRAAGLRRIAVRLVGEGRAVLRPLTAVGLVAQFTRCATAEAALDSEG